MDNLTSIIIAVVAIIPATTIGVLTYMSSVRNRKQIDATKAIVLGNGRGNVTKVSEDTQDLAYETVCRLDQHIKTTDERHAETVQQIKEIRQDIGLIISLVRRD